jgi:hypothetical protein
MISIHNKLVCAISVPMSFLKLKISLCFLEGGAALGLELRAFTLVWLVLLPHDSLCQPSEIILYKLKK